MNDSILRYQNEALRTAVYPGQHSREGLLYTVLGLCGEAGEIANKVTKIMRDDHTYEEMMQRKDQIVDELGDVLWYITMLSLELGLPLGEVADRNLRKLSLRKQMGTLKGDGDTR